MAMNELFNINNNFCEIKALQTCLKYTLCEDGGKNEYTH